jgi:PadR family transcriptional regulator, regulatory protein PadR
MFAPARKKFQCFPRARNYTYSYFANIMSREYLGEFEQVVLMALLHLGEEGYGLTVRREIKKRTGRNASLGALYSALNRMESKGYVASWLGDPTPQRGWKSKRYFRIEPAGALALQRAQKMLALMAKGLSWNPR